MNDILAQLSKSCSLRDMGVSYCTISLLTMICGLMTQDRPHIETLFIISTMLPRLLQRMGKIQVLFWLTDERKFSSSVDHLTNATSPSMLSTESRSTGLVFDARSSSNHVPLSPALVGTNTRRSRPSFLDSINTFKEYSASLPLIEPQKALLLQHEVYMPNLDFLEENDDEVDLTCQHFIPSSSLLFFQFFYVS